MKTKLVPFFVEKAKAGNRVVTEEGNSVRIIDFNRKTESTYKIVAEVLDDNGDEYPFIYDHLGEPQNDAGPKLFIEEEVKTRRMTNQELSWWLDGPLEEHRECIRTSWIYRRYSYLNGEANKPVEADIYIRKNGGEWQEPLIEI